MIFVHGRGAEPRAGFRIAGPFAAAGIPSLLIHYRNDEGQPGDDGVADFGTTEWEDLEGAVGSVLARGAADVVLVGSSMGAAVVAAFMERSPLADVVAGIVFDSPALKLGAMIDARAADTTLPLLPMPVPAALTATAKQIAAWRFGIDWDELDYLERIGRLDVPVLLFHGTSDDAVPVWISDAAADALGDRATYIRVRGAGHIRAWNVDRERYEAAVARFIAGLDG
jgi:alpha-beta hydrolase superfamily lysophospholipase